MPSTVDWYYHRKGCVTCQKMDASWNPGNHSQGSGLANKNRLGVPEALELVGKCQSAGRQQGDKTYEIDLKKEPKTAEELQALIIGPTGNLRAPTIRHGKPCTWVSRRRRSRLHSAAEYPVAHYRDRDFASIQGRHASDLNL